MIGKALEERENALEDLKAIHREFFELTNSTTRPSHLYHYTSFESFINIVADKGMHASHRYYLNDQDDLLHGITTCEEIVSEWAKNKSPLHRNISDIVLLKSKQWRDESFRSAYTYSVSFTEQRDGAAQWQVYGDHGRGLIICFDFQRLEQALFQPGHDGIGTMFSLNKVIYDPKTKNEKTVKMLDKALHCIQRNDFLLSLASGTAAEYIETLATQSYKQEAFDSEKEWRATPYPLSKMIDLVQFNVRRNAIRPYINLEFDPTAIDELIIGSAISDPYIENTLKLFLEKQGLPEVKVTRSTVRLSAPL